MRGKLNPDLEQGDKIVCLHMEGELSVPPGTLGTVMRVTRDPFEKDGKLIEVNWENGSGLSLVSTTDAWKKIESEPHKLNENDANWNFVTTNADVFQYFDWRWFRNYLKILRDSGIINMYESSPLIYSGREHIERYYGEGRENEPEFQELLDNADEAKQKLIEGVVDYMVENGKDLDNIDMVNRFARHFSQKLLGVYITFVNMTGNF